MNYKLPGGLVVFQHVIHIEQIDFAYVTEYNRIPDIFNSHDA